MSMGMATSRGETAFSILAGIKHLDLYVLLGAQPKASHEEIKQAYEKRAVKWRPDNNREDSQLLLKAFTVLSDKAARRDYDEILTARKAENNNDDDVKKEIKGKRKREEEATEDVKSITFKFSRLSLAGRDTLERKKCKKEQTEEEEKENEEQKCCIMNNCSTPGL